VHARRHSDQLAFAPDDPVHMGLRNGWAMGGVFFDFDFEKQIQTREITHEALTNRRTAARIRSPLAPAASQTAFKVIIRQTPSANKVEIAILESFLAKENSVSDGRVSLRKLYLLQSRDENSRRFLDAFVNNWNSFLTRETHILDHRPKSLPKNRDPMYSNCHSGQGGIDVAILIMAYSSPFSCRMPDPRSNRSGTAGGGGSMDRHFVWFDLNRQQGYPMLAQRFSLLSDESLVVRRLESRSQLC
jgi:hypothetical protein